MNHASSPTTPCRSSAISLLRLTSYERVSGMLTAVLLLLCGGTLLLLLFWLGMGSHDSPSIAKLQLGKPGSGSGQNPAPVLNAEPSDLDFGAESFPQSPFFSPQLSHIMEVVAAESSALDLVDRSQSRVKGISGRIGDDREIEIGCGGIDPGAIWDRWEIQYELTNLQNHAQMLDHFQIELGVAGGGIEHVDYVRNLSAAAPLVRRGAASKENRLRFLDRAGEVRAAHRALAAKGGINLDGRVVFLFYPAELTARLLALETASLGGRELSTVRKTMFGVTGKSGQWEFVVLRQDFHSAPVAN